MKYLYFLAVFQRSCSMNAFYNVLMQYFDQIDVLHISFQIVLARIANKEIAT